MKFTKIGVGEIKQTKAGKPAIQLILDPKAQALIPNNDFMNSIWIFKVETSRGVSYTVNSMVPNDYEYEPGFTKKEVASERKELERKNEETLALLSGE